ncbi:hypothetical protein EGH24_12860 [Halonotius terrestris]|jgi:hypothetical protein|uniref:Uncharacterized protein n=1 Tax=Halonotius terrestris TaxID=2487750 RepID=A0A8J8P7H5_9EURY|nr:hypothetical protein [Halonotius terrestris]TQQ78732.1 hypothetical protein EGH24_12860 [Halonotius terrestris]
MHSAVISVVVSSISVIYPVLGVFIQFPFDPVCIFGFPLKQSLLSPRVSLIGASITFWMMVVVGTVIGWLNRRLLSVF